MSGDRTYSYLWKEHYKDLDGVIFVVDSTDKIRFALAHDELMEILKDDNIKKREVAILIFANKMDLK